MRRRHWSRQEGRIILRGPFRSRRSRLIQERRPGSLRHCAAFLCRRSFNHEGHEGPRRNKLNSLCTFVTFMVEELLHFNFFLILRDLHVPSQFFLHQVAQLADASGSPCTR